jgi:TonB family protein
MKEAELRFTLPMFPSTLITKERGDGVPERQRHVFDSSADGVDYRVFVVENPEPRQSLDAFIKREDKKPKWDPASEREVTVDGVVGKLFVYPNGKGMVQFFATENYLFKFYAKGAPADDARLTKFFSSITLKKTDAQPPAVAENSADSGEKVYISKDVDIKAKFLSQPDINFPPDGSGTRGIVILQCIFTSRGTVTNIKVIQGLPNGLTEKAIEAAKKIKFVPATKDGKPVSMWMQLEYNFNMYDIR